MYGGILDIVFVLNYYDYILFNALLLVSVFSRFVME